ncbi:MAG: VWA domain-containing protein [Myxococcota bacterium]
MERIKIAMLVGGLAVVGCGDDDRDAAGTGATLGGVSGLTSAGGVDGSGGLDDGGFDSESADGTGDDTGTFDDSGSGACDEDTDCPSGEVCTPYSNVCVPPGGCSIDADCELEGLTCSGGSCTSGGDCGDATFNITQLDPNVMILLDRSGSMSDDVPGSGQSRWDVAKTVVNATVAEFNQEVRFGLATFSACIPGQSCSPGAIEIAVSPNNAGAITQFMNGTDDGIFGYLCNSGQPETSTGRSLDALVGNPLLQDPGRDNAVLLITDGGESQECTPVDGPTGAGNLFAQDIPVRTFAVGFGFSGPQLEAIAQAGGTGQSYTADDQASLNTALSTILGGIASCTFQLDEVPPDPNELYVFLNSDPAGIPVDAANGYTYDPGTNSITLHGTTCDAVVNGDSAKVDVVYGCPNPPPAG